MPNMRMIFIFHLLLSYLWAADVPVQEITCTYNTKTLDALIKTKNPEAFKAYIRKLSHNPKLKSSEKIDLYHRTLATENTTLFIIIRQYISLGMNGLTTLTSALCQTESTTEQLDLLLQHVPSALDSALINLIENKKFNNFELLLVRKRRQVDEDMALRLFYYTIKYHYYDLTNFIRKQVPNHANSLANEIVILSSYFKNEDVFVKFYSLEIISDAALATVWALVDSDRPFGMSIRSAIKCRTDAMKPNGYPPGTYPQFNNIPARKFTNLHNSLLHYNACLYRIKIIMSTMPFIPPYQVIFDEDEYSSHLDFNLLFFSKPYRSLTPEIYYQSYNRNPYLQEEAHLASFTEFSSIDTEKLTLFIELTPLEAIPPSPLPDIWQLNTLATDFNLLSRDERFRGYASEKTLLESSESDQDGYLSLDENSDSDSYEPSPNERDCLLRTHSEQGKS